MFPKFIIDRTRHQIYVDIEMLVWVFNLKCIYNDLKINILIKCIYTFQIEI